jgi:hypothetical protein
VFPILGNSERALAERTSSSEVISEISVPAAAQGVGKDIGLRRVANDEINEQSKRTEGGEDNQGYPIRVLRHIR